MVRKKNDSFGKRTKESLFVDRLAKVINSSATNAKELAAQESKSSFWINPLRAPVEETQKELDAFGVSATGFDWLPNAFGLESDKHALTESAAFQEGRVYIQNASSMVAVHALDPQPSEMILDVCASPGGKASRAASLTNNEIQLWANDSIKPRVAKMEGVFAQFGVKPTNVTQHPGQYVDKFIDETFDKIILDAQCSGEAMMNPEKPGRLRYWSEERVQEMSYLQQKMLVSAWKLLKPGGVLIYSTCTYGPEENESPVNFLLQHHDDADVEPIDVPLPHTMAGITRWEEKNFDTRVKNALRILPSEYTEAFFVCRLRKTN